MTVDQQEHRARRLWRALEPVHAVTYFTPEPRAACDALGTRGFWPSYFAQRAAPLGAVGPGLVTALFHGFHPAFVARSVPAVWAVATPERFVAARLDAVDAALRRLLGPDLLSARGTAEAAMIARDAARTAPLAGRGLAAANAALPWPDDPHLVLWHAQTVLRETRGDGHVAALTVAGLAPVEALVLIGAEQDMPTLRQFRGWSEEEWTAAGEGLAARGLLEAGGPAARPVLTGAGRALRAEVEARTDALADVSWTAVGPSAADRLVDLAAPIVSAIVAGGGFQPRSPIGLRPLTAELPTPCPGVG